MTDKPSSPALAPPDSSLTVALPNRPGKSSSSVAMAGPVSDVSAPVATAPVSDEQLPSSPKPSSPQAPSQPAQLPAPVSQFGPNQPARRPSAPTTDLQLQLQLQEEVESEETGVSAASPTVDATSSPRNAALAAVTAALAAVTAEDDAQSTETVSNHQPNPGTTLTPQQVDDSILTGPGDSNLAPPVITAPSTKTRQSESPPPTDSDSDSDSELSPPPDIPADWESELFPAPAMTDSTPEHGKAHPHPHPGDWGDVSLLTPWQLILPHLGPKFLGRPPPAGAYKSLQHCPAIRPLPTFTRRPGSEAKKLVLSRSANINGALVHITGVLAERPCRSCRSYSGERGMGVFGPCIVPHPDSEGALPGGACSNCVWAQPRRCDHASEHQRAKKYETFFTEESTKLMKRRIGPAKRPESSANVPAEQRPADEGQDGGDEYSTDEDEYVKGDRVTVRRGEGPGSLVSSTNSLSVAPTLQSHYESQFTRDPPPRTEPQCRRQPAVEPMHPESTGRVDSAERTPGEPAPKRARHVGENPLLTIKVDQLNQMTAAEIAQVKMEMAIWEAAFCIVDAEEEQVDVVGVARGRKSVDARLRGVEEGDVMDVDGF